MKKKGLLGLALCAMLVAPVAGCNKDDDTKETIEGVYTFEKVEVLLSDSNIVSTKCSFANPTNFDDDYCVDVDREFEITKDKFIMREGDVVVELDYTITRDVFVVDGLSSVENPVLLYDDGKIVAFVEGKYVEDENNSNDGNISGSLLKDSRIIYSKK